MELFHAEKARRERLQNACLSGKEVFRKRLLMKWDTSHATCSSGNGLWQRVFRYRNMPFASRGKEKGSCFPPLLLPFIPSGHGAQPGNAVGGVGVRAEEAGHAAAKEWRHDEQFGCGGVAVLHGDTLIP